MNEIWVNGKKPRFGANFGPFAPNWTNISYKDRKFNQHNRKNAERKL